MSKLAGSFSARPGRAGRLDRRPRSGEGGFSLIELMISLVAGLMVTMAVMGVSKEATNTFHEEVRVAGAEMGVRVAAERLRLDLQRAAFMSTGNIAADPNMARMKNATTNTANIAPPIPPSLLTLSGVRINVGQAFVNLDPTYGPELAGQGIVPDSIDIGGNFSSSDEYPVLFTTAPTGVPAGCSTTGALQIQMESASGWRLRNAEAAATAAGALAGTAMLALFHPGTSTTSQFALRIADPTGHYQFVLGCPGIGAVSYNTGTSPPTATVYISGNSTILQGNQASIGGVGGYGVGLTTVSPVQIAHWDIQTVGQLRLGQAPGGTVPATTPTEFNVTAVGSTSTYDPDEFVLTRCYIDFSVTANPACDTTTTEVIAEYAVDLRFGMTVDTGNPCVNIPCPVTAPTYLVNPHTYYPIDGPTLLSTLGVWTGVTYPPTPGRGPERIRDIQARVAVRSPVGDRVTTLAGTGSYLYRYHIVKPALHQSAQYSYARVREVVTNVTLPNQAGFFW